MAFVSSLPIHLRRYFEQANATANRTCSLIRRQEHGKYLSNFYRRQNHMMTTNSRTDKHDPLNPSNPIAGTAKETAIVVVDHGSKRQAANDMIFRVADDVRNRTPADMRVVPAHMELATPSIGDAVAECAQHGITHVIVVPFFLSPGRHATEDIPQLTEDAVRQFPGMTFEVRPPIGTHPSIIDIVLDSAGILSE